ncbi:hypothetical protein KFL_001050070 [Klebsormidium nitens]|uniref:Uncharacterized protein n=1 Tax=Klebsormidium nitens TaxID=105231 RepID=A0A1Y1HWS9_KLENI|nr:hypothetical protein KFL_001050070 [Klebsormidium nitens]|eukprot:GAQ82242.1 hypothetical protein KFL_001050070 [Klebsormidium nitens]
MSQRGVLTGAGKLSVLRFALWRVQESEAAIPVKDFVLAICRDMCEAAVQALEERAKTLQDDLSPNLPLKRTDLELRVRTAENELRDLWMSLAPRGLPRALADVFEEKVTIALEGFESALRTLNDAAIETKGKKDLDATINQMEAEMAAALAPEKLPWDNESLVETGEKIHEKAVSALFAKFGGLSPEDATELYTTVRRDAFRQRMAAYETKHETAKARAALESAERKVDRSTSAKFAALKQMLAAAEGEVAKIRQQNAD